MTVKVGRQDWQNRAQAFEIDHWRSKNEVTAQELIGEKCWTISQQILQRHGFTQNQFAGKTVLDIGCGPTGRLSWLNGARIVALDPLFAEYQKLPWFDGGIYADYFARPAEEFIPQLNGQVDFAWSINCLDHCFDLDTALTNIRRYLKLAGTAFVSCDVDKWVAKDETHPLCMTHEDLEDAIRAAEFIIDRQAHGACEPAHEGGWKNCYGGADGCATAYHFWVRR